MGRGWYDLLGHAKPLFYAAAPTAGGQTVVTARGLAAQPGTSTSTGGALGAVDGVVQLLDDCTLLIEAYATSSSTLCYSLASIVGDAASETASENFLFQFSTLQGGTADYAAFWEGAGGANVTNNLADDASETDPPVNTWGVYGCSRRTADNNISFLRDGKLRASTTYSTTEATSGENARFMLGYSSRAGSTAAGLGELWRGYVTRPVFWNRALSDEELAYLTRCPLAVYEPDSMRTYFLPAAGAAPPGGFKSAWASRSTVTIQPGMVA